MNTKILLILLLIFIVGAGSVFYVYRQLSLIKQKQAEENTVKSVVEGFGKVLKNVSLLAPRETVSQSIEENYKNFLAPALLTQWKGDPLKALGRLTSSPWPERIEITSIKQFGSGAYDVSGNIIEITSVEQVEGGVAAKRSIELAVVKFGDNWLIVSANAGEYADPVSCTMEAKLCPDGSYVGRTGPNCEFSDCPGKTLAEELADCLPKSDALSHEKCTELLKLITSYEECVDAGFSILKSNPPQCLTPDGRTFIQNEIKN